MECWKWVAKEVYQWGDKRTSKWVYVLRQHNICKWLAKRNRKVLSWSSKGLIFFRADIGCEKVFLKKLAFFWHHRARCWGRYDCTHQEDVSSISITVSLLFPSDGPMFQSEMDLDEHCHILEIWLSPTLKISGHLWSQLQSCIVTSLYARKVIFLKFTKIDILYILVFYNSCTPDVTIPSTTNSLFSIDTLYFLKDFTCYLFSDLFFCLFCYLV